EDAEPAAAARPRRARRAAGSAGRLSLLWLERAATLYRQEPQSARARRRAFLVRLSMLDRPSAIRRAPADRVRGDRGRDRRAATRVGAREITDAGAQLRAATQDGVRRA